MKIFHPIIYLWQIRGRGQIIREIMKEESIVNQMSRETVCDSGINTFLIEKVYSGLSISLFLFENIFEDEMTN